MAEPEDLILEGAYLASRAAREVWRRYSPPAPPEVLALKDVRLRIEIFVNALTGKPFSIVAAAPPPPLNWLARMALRPGTRPPRDACPGTDGTRIYLPPTIDLAKTSGALEVYLLLATGQAVRGMRGSTAAALGIAGAEIRDRFLIADAAAVDRWIVRHAPGLRPRLLAVREDALSSRPAKTPGTLRTRDVEDLIGRVLRADPLAEIDDLPMDGTSADALAWARSLPPRMPNASRYTAVSLPIYWGRPMQPGAAATAGPEAASGDGPQQRKARQRVADLRRRPRVREAEEGEDDRGSGMWVIRPDEPQESVEDPFGLQRPTDRADDVDPEGLGDSLSELAEARVVRTPGQSREVLLSEDELPKAARTTSVVPAAAGISYPEWDYRSGTYRVPGAVVRESAAPAGDPAWVSAALARHHRLVRRVRTRFERLRPRRTSIDRQPDGPELDIAAYVTAAADLQGSGVADDRLYIALRPARRELTVALLVDVSASTDSWVSGNRRIVDVEKEALLVVCEALDALGDRHAIFAFSGEGPDAVSVTPVKTFAERTGDGVRRRIAALESDRYTRLGAAIRHATTALSRQPTERRLLLVLSDGKPNDVDAYEGPYGIEDARQAVAEGRAQNVHVFCLTVDREAPRYAPRIFGPAGFTLLRQPDQLPVVLIDVLRRLIRP